ncbi:hypothetical protein FNF27_03998 [Cafeteria roenbergensis]|uniref:UmuC domain-containing protein n=1 Tax=Cafeteria roenbergensis TaxID=33653 RepID=A0A5A8E9T8_CAFRO|nr:hypothetical protein FNF28_05182 [Cafeteria roenbergensis]KAA0174623.1 hypothetical protein FNF27_03998 [Cafeteria roenbergensis]
MENPPEWPSDEDSDADDPCALEGRGRLRAAGGRLAAPVRPDRCIIALDIDAFYAQVAELRDGSLRGRPVAIQQKAICVTCNYEARAFGVHKLQRIAEAKRMCPRLVLVSGEDLTPFRAVSSAVFELIRSAFTPHVQRLGMDEVFLDVSDAVDALEAGCPLEPPSTPSLPWAGFVFAGQPHAKATVERQVPLAALAHGC